jgi:hypothetical protein
LFSKNLTPLIFLQRLVKAVVCPFATALMICYFLHTVLKAEEPF